MDYGYHSASSDYYLDDWRSEYCRKKLYQELYWMVLSTVYGSSADDKLYRDCGQWMDSLNGLWEGDDLVLGGGGRDQLLGDGDDITRGAWTRCDRRWHW